MKNTEIPSTEQVEALKAWAALYGRNWKSPLRDAWMAGDYGSFQSTDTSAFSNRFVTLLALRGWCALFCTMASAMWFRLLSAPKSTKLLLTSTHKWEDGKP